MMHLNVHFIETNTNFTLNETFISLRLTNNENVTLSRRQRVLPKEILRLAQGKTKEVLSGEYYRNKNQFRSFALED